MFKFIKKNIYFICIFLILILAIFFRTYDIAHRFSFAHDGDLYSWIVKDIVVNHHIRLIGQLTSSPGVFIGGLFYYLLIPFFLLFNMDPIGVSLLGVIVGIVTILSYYFILNRLFNRIIGLIAAFLHAILLANVNFDRWIVPTLPTKLWAVWYFYVLFSISRGNFSVLPLLGILIGLIWHVHIALAPALLAIPVSLIISRKIPSIKILLFSAGTFLITSLPLILFETRHNFSQTTSIVQNLIIPQDGENGLPKFIKVLGMIARNSSDLLFYPQSIPQDFKILFLILLLASTFFLIRKKILKFKEALIIFSWIIPIVLFFSISRTPISEYYFANIDVPILIIVSMIIYLLIKFFKPGLSIVIIILAIILVKNLSFFIQDESYIIGYVDRKAVIASIEKDVKNHNYPCIGITYISKFGDNFGFRYFFYLSKLHLVHPSLDVPVYNIVVPDELSNEVEEKFGHIGLIKPTSIPSKEAMEKSCLTPDTNLTDSMFGYVD